MGNEIVKEETLDDEKERNVLVEDAAAEPNLTVVNKIEDVPVQILYKEENEETRNLKNVVKEEENENESTENESKENDIQDRIVVTPVHKESIKESIRRKTSNLVAPHNHEITNYCKSLINVSFHGQVTLKAQLELYNLLGEDSSYTLAALLQSFHQFLQSFGNTHLITGEEEEFRYYVQGLMERRNQNDMDRFWRDAKKFIDIYKTRGGIANDF